MAHEHLVKWGRDAVEKGLSLTQIESYLLKRGLKQRQALNALHEITSFEHKIKEEAKSVKKSLIVIFVLLLLVVSGFLVLYFSGIFKV